MSVVVGEGSLATSALLPPTTAGGGAARTPNNNTATASRTVESRLPAAAVLTNGAGGGSAGGSRSPAGGHDRGSSDNNNNKTTTPGFTRTTTILRRDSKPENVLPIDVLAGVNANSSSSGGNRSGVGTTRQPSVQLEAMGGATATIATFAAEPSDASSSSSSNEGGGTNGSVQQSFTFERALESEMEVADCFALLLSVHAATRMFSEWSLGDLQILAQLLTVLRFKEGEAVIEAGESASFVAILLSGSLQVHLPPPTVVASSGAAGEASSSPPAPINMRPGGLLGEFSCFEGGTRTAAVRAVGSAGAAVAILTFAELESLRLVVPEIRMKFMLMFALEGLKKLRRVLDAGTPQAGGFGAEAVLLQQQQQTPQMSSVSTPLSAVTPIYAAMGTTQQQQQQPLPPTVLEDMPSSPVPDPSARRSLVRESSPQRSRSASPAAAEGTVSVTNAVASSPAAAAVSLPPAAVAASTAPTPASGGPRSRRTMTRRGTLSAFGATNFFATAVAASAAAEAKAAAAEPSSRRSTANQATQTAIAAALAANASGVGGMAASALSPTRFPGGGARGVEAMLRNRGVSVAPTGISAPQLSSPTNSTTSGSSTTATNEDAASASAAAKRAKHKLLTVQLVISGQERQLQLRTQQIEQLSLDLAKSSEGRKEAQAALAREQRLHAAVREERTNLANQVQVALNQARILERQVAVLESQLGGNVSAFSAAHAEQMREAAAQLRAEQERRAVVEGELRSLRDSLSTAVSDLGVLKSRSVLESSHAAQDLSEARTRCTNLENDLAAARTRARDMADALAQAQAAQRAQTVIAEEQAVSAAQSFRLFSSTAERLRKQTRYLSSYKRVLRRMLIVTFVHSFRNKQALREAQVALVEAHALLRNDILKDASSAGSAAEAGRDGALLGSPLPLVVTRASDGGGSGGGIFEQAFNGVATTTGTTVTLVPNEKPDNSLAASSTSSNKSTEEEKEETAEGAPSSLSIVPSSLSVALAPGLPRKVRRPALRESVTSLTTLVGLVCASALKLPPLCAELCRLRAFWSDSSSVFFARSIEVKQSLLEVEQALVAEKKAHGVTRRRAEQMDEVESALRALEAGGIPETHPFLQAHSAATLQAAAAAVAQSAAQHQRVSSRVTSRRTGSVAAILGFNLTETTGVTAPTVSSSQRRAANRASMGSGGLGGGLKAASSSSPGTGMSGAAMPHDSEPNTTTKAQLSTTATEANASSAAEAMAAAAAEADAPGAPAPAASLKQQFGHIAEASDDYVEAGAPSSTAAAGATHKAKADKDAEAKEATPASETAHHSSGSVFSPSRPAHEREKSASSSSPAQARRSWRPAGRSPTRNIVSPLVPTSAPIAAAAGLPWKDSTLIAPSPPSSSRRSAALRSPYGPSPVPRSTATAVQPTTPSSSAQAHARPGSGTGLQLPLIDSASSASGARSSNSAGGSGQGMSNGLYARTPFTARSHTPSERSKNLSRNGNNASSSAEEAKHAPPQQSPRQPQQPPHSAREKQTRHSLQRGAGLGGGGGLGHAQSREARRMAKEESGLGVIASSTAGGAPLSSPVAPSLASASPSPAPSPMMRLTYSQALLASPSPFVATHVVHGHLASTADIYSQTQQRGGAGGPPRSARGRSPRRRNNDALLSPKRGGAAHSPPAAVAVTAASSRSSAPSKEVDEKQQPQPQTATPVVDAAAATVGVGTEAAPTAVSEPGRLNASQAAALVESKQLPAPATGEVDTAAAATAMPASADVVAIAPAVASALAESHAFVPAQTV